jgi:DNA-directed RNA polymerase II subunit RPB1
MSGGAPLPPSKCELKRVNEVQFEVFKERQVKDYAVCLIDQLKTYENGVAVEGGINDLRMGTTDFDQICQTCKMSRPHCPGHFGYIELAEPMFSLGMFDVVLQALKCVCKTCGGLLVDPNSADVKAIHSMCKSGPNRLREMVRVCGNRRKCGWKDSNNVERGCGAEQPKIGRFQGNYPGLVIKATVGEQDVRWYAEDARKVFDNVSDETAKALGFDVARCHPKDLLLTVLAVPPPHVRPSVSFGSGKNDNELTHKLMQILKTNITLRKKKEDRDTDPNIEKVRVLLQEHVGTYFHNSSTLYKPNKLSETLKLKSLTERLKGKYGRLRGNLMGKRVDFSARTVITGDPNIDVDEVGVPFSVAMTLTFPERVNQINKKRLTEFVRRDGYPGANYIIHANGTQTPLDRVKDRSALTLHIGDIVERHIINGDVVLFNRQPTLHRMSMMGHRVRVLNYNTFRLNLSCTTPYNADFDGDEMNLHVPQSLLNKAELIEMMMVPKNFVSPNKSAPCMGIVQDSLLGCYRITDKETFLDKYFVQSVAMWIDQWELPIPAIIKPRPLWTGKQIFSLVLPEVNIHPAHTSDPKEAEKVLFSHKDETLLVHRGQLLSGAIKKGIVGASPGSLIHVIFNDRGSDEVAKFINGVQRVTAYFLYNFSFSVGLQDTVADKGTLKKINLILQQSRMRVRKIAATANKGATQRKAGMTLLQTFETDINSELNSCREKAAKKALSSVRRTNSFKVMIEAGSKGSDLNICQIAVLVGQQNVNGQRIPFQFRRRTLPHFTLDDYGESARGMVIRGYVEGLQPYEFFFHTMGGREGLIDTAVKTAATGYLQRKLIKALEDVHAAYDGTVRNANRDLLQFMYGEDGLDGARIEGSQPFPLPFHSDKDMEELYRYEYDSSGAFKPNMGDGYLNEVVKNRMQAEPSTIVKLEAEFQQLLEDRRTARESITLEPKLKLNLPVNVDRLIRNAQVAAGVHRSSALSNLYPSHVIEMVSKLQQDLKQLFSSYNRLGRGVYSSPYSEGRVTSALGLFNMHLRQILASKRVIKEYRLNDHSFQFLLTEIRAKYQQSMIHPGEMIGAIAAQSCGEPATQMTLNTFHNAGISSKNVTLGVPRLLELLNVSKNQKNSSMMVRMVPPYHEKKKTQTAQHQIEYCTLEHVTRSIQIIYEPEPTATCIQEDAAMIETEWHLLDDVQHDVTSARLQEARNGSPWVVRMELEKNLLNDKQITVKHIKDFCKRKGVDNDYIIEINYVNDEDLSRVLRLRPKKNFAEESIPTLKRTIPSLLASIQLRGIPGVTKALLKEITTFPVDRETQGIKQEKVWAVDTEGTALKRVFGGVYDKKGVNMVDCAHTSSNNIPEVYQILGIEAARLKLLLELREAYLAYSVAINYRHYTTLVDIMSQRGYLMPVSRVGINRSDASGPLMRCSFEETVKVLMSAAAFGERDQVRGVSANLILGNQARIGTGIFDLILDVAALQTAVPQERAVEPGPIANVYHGEESVMVINTAVAQQRHPGGMHQTPLATDKSTVYATTSASASRHQSVDSAAFSDFAAEDFTTVIEPSPFQKDRWLPAPDAAPVATRRAPAGVNPYAMVYASEHHQHSWAPLSSKALVSETDHEGVEVSSFVAPSGAVAAFAESPSYESSHRSNAPRGYVPGGASASQARPTRDQSAAAEYVPHDDSSDGNESYRPSEVESEVHPGGALGTAAVSRAQSSLNFSPSQGDN